MSGTATELEGTSRVSEHWEAQFAKNRVDPSLWTNNPLVARHINELITDEHHHWLPWFLNCYVPADVVFHRSVSICCGDGAHELVLANSGRVKFITGFDISSGALDQARAAFAAAGIKPDTYRFDHADANDLNATEAADLILSTGALHHVTKLEALLSRLAQILTPEGYFVVLEYVGPTHFQWREAQVNIINAIVERLDPRYLRDGVRIQLSPPVLSDFLAIDPSEAVRSEEILPLLEEFFVIEYLRNFNGTIVHPLYPLLNPAFTAADAPDFNSILRLVLLLEDELIRSKVLSSDFVFAICRSKRAPSVQESSAEKTRIRAKYVGFIDRFDESGVYGWAVNLDAMSAPLRLDLYLDEELKASVFADTFRHDLLQAGYGDGRHAFALVLDSPPPRGARARIVVSGTNMALASRVASRVELFAQR